MSKSAEKPQAITSFNYEVLDFEQRIVVQQRTGEIRDRLRRSAQEIWEIGQKLVDVRSRLKHGQFDTWLKAEFGWSRRTAYNFINVYETFGKRANLAQVDIATSALYLLAAPSTSKEVRDEFLQRAKEGESVTHKDLRQVMNQEKLSFTPAAEKPEQPTEFTPKPEIITIIPKAVVEVKTVAVEDQAPLRSASPTVATSYDIQPGWYLLDQQHLLFCGDTASFKFFERTPQAALALAITSDDWDHDWLIDKARSVLIFPESALKEQMIEQLILMFSTLGDTVIFPWLPDGEIIAVAHKLRRNICAGDPDSGRCSKAIAQSGLKAKRLNL